MPAIKNQKTSLISVKNLKSKAKSLLSDQNIGPSTSPEIFKLNPKVEIGSKNPAAKKVVEIKKINTKTNQKLSEELKLAKSESLLKVDKSIEITFLSRSKIGDYFGVIHEMFAFIKTKKRLNQIIQKMNENQETYYVGLLVGGVPMGFCEFNITYQLWGELICYVNHLIVKKESRGLGLGTKLLDFVIDFAQSQDCEGIELRSDLFRKKAHTFYYKKGFGIDCFNFRKNLK